MEASARQASYPNLRRPPKGQGPPTAGKPGGNGAWTKKNKRKLVATNSHTPSEKHYVLSDQTVAGKVKRQKLFLEGLAEFGTVKAGCRAADIDRATFYKWMENDSDFKLAVDYAFEDHTDDLEQEGYARAKDKSDLLLMFFIKARRPKFRDNFKGEGGSKPEDEVEEQRGAAAIVKDRLAGMKKKLEEKASTKALKGNVRGKPSEETLEDDVGDI